MSSCVFDCKGTFPVHFFKYRSSRILLDDLTVLLKAIPRNILSYLGTFSRVSSCVFDCKGTFPVHFFKYRSSRILLDDLTVLLQAMPRNILSVVELCVLIARVRLKAIPRNMLSVVELCFCLQGRVLGL